MDEFKKFDEEIIALTLRMMGLIDFPQHMAWLAVADPEAASGGVHTDFDREIWCTVAMGLGD